MSLVSRHRHVLPVASQACQRAQLTQQSIKKSFSKHKNVSLISLELNVFSLLE